MPVEIRELIIHASVQESEVQQGVSEQAVRQTGANTPTDRLTFELRNELIEECVQRVLELLERKNNR